MARMRDMISISWPAGDTLACYATTQHASSSYGVPVIVCDGQALGAADLRECSITYRGEPYVPLIVARALSLLSRQRLDLLGKTGAIRRRKDPHAMRWLYHVGDVQQHCATAQPGRPRRARD